MFASYLVLAPTITTHPQDVLSSAGGSVQFTCSAQSSGGSPAIAWERVAEDSSVTPVTTGITTATPSPTITDSTLDIPIVAYSSFGMYRCVATISSMSTQSNTAILTGNYFHTFHSHFLTGACSLIYSITSSESHLPNF